MNQSVTMIWPSGFRLGTSTKITLSRIFFTSGESLGREPVHELHRHLRRADLGRVDAARDQQHDDFALRKISSRSASVGAPPWKYSFRSSCL